MMLRTSNRCRLTAFLLAALLCGFSCIDSEDAQDASNTQAETKNIVVDDEAVKETTTSIAGPEINDSMPMEMEAGESKIEELVGELSAADGVNSSADSGHLEHANVTVGEDEAGNSSVTSEGGASVSVPRWNCSLMSLFGEDEEPKVLILKNETQLAKIISNSNESQSCFLLYFFVSWCEFCAEFSVEINAIGRIFHGLPVIGVDAYTLSSIAGKFGITGVPCLILFHDGRPVAKFNRSRSLQGLEDFIFNSTGIVANKSVEIHDADFAGPLPTKIEAHGDIYLLLSALSIALILIVNFCFTDRVSAFCLSNINRFKEWAVHQKKD